MQYFQGDILTEEGFLQGYVQVDSSTGIPELGKGTPPKKPLVKGIILPSFVNSHIHIGDSFIREKHLDLPRSIPELVAPPSGLKHRLLKETTEQEIRDGIHQSLEQMTTTGTKWFCDFREGGLIGVYQLKKEMKNIPLRSLIFSRPSTLTYVKEEIDSLLENSAGIGLSSISDYEPSEIKKIAQHVRKKKKMFALHASEVARENIDDILDLHPSLLIHMITATQHDLECVKDQKIPIVICPRSYGFFRLKHNIPLMKKTGVTILVGTDNAMINTPNMCQELSYLRHTKLFPLQEMLTNVTYTPRKALNLDDDIQGRTLLHSFIVIERDSLQPAYIHRETRDEKYEN